MINTKKKKSRIEGCGKLPFFEVAGTKTGECCAQHAPEGMVDARSRNCRTEGCRKKPSLGVANTRTAEYRAKHTRLQYGIEVFRGEKVGPHHSGKKTTVIPSVAKHASVRPPPTTKCQPSFASRDSRKRVRHLEITSTASKRAVARESTAEVMTMPDIDGQKSPVKRNFSVQVKVQLSL